MEKHTNFVRKIELPRSGNVEFKAWEKAKFIAVWMKDLNGRATTPHLILEDCPTRKQLTYRFLVVEGEAPLPLEERWVAMGMAWSTRHSFGTIFMSADVDRSKKPKKAEKEEPREIVDERVGEEVDAYAP